MEFKVIAEETKTRINREEFYRIYRSLFEDYYKIVEELKETQQKIEKIQKKYAPNLSQKYFELEELRKKQNAITRTSKDLVNKGSINNSDDVLSRQISTKREELKKLMVSMSKQVEPLENDLQRLSKAKKLKVATLSGKTGIGMLAAAALFYAYKSSKRVRESILHECHFDDIKKIREEVKEYIEQLKMDREEELMKTNELDNPDVRDDTRANIDRYYDDKINELVDKLRNTLDSIKIKTSK